MQEEEEVLLQGHVPDPKEDPPLGVALDLGGDHPGFRLLEGKPLPPGWTGKNWACWQLAQAARGEVLVFTDADVAWGEGALGGLLWALEGEDLVSVLPRQEVAGPLLAPVPFVMGGLFSFLPYPFLKALRVANGQVLAFRREAYFALGGHEAVRGEVLEDVALARRAGRYGLYLAPRLFAARMYRGYGEMLEGFGKNFLEIHLKNPAILLGSWFYHLALYTLPWAFGRWELGLMGLLERALVQRATGGPPLARPPGTLGAPSPPARLPPRPPAGEAVEGAGLALGRPPLASMKPWPSSLGSPPKARPRYPRGRGRPWA